MVKEIEKDVDELEAKPVKGDSEAKANYRRIIEAYKKSNPVKYEIKKAALEARLASL